MPLESSNTLYTEVAVFMKQSVQNCPKQIVSGIVRRQSQSAISIRVNLLRREEINLFVTKFSLLAFAVERLAFIRLKLGYEEVSNFYLYVYALSYSV